MSGQAGVFGRDLLLVLLLAGIAFLVWAFCRLVVESRPSHSAMESRAFIAKAVKPRTLMAKQAGPPLLPDPDVESGTPDLDGRHLAPPASGAQRTGRQPST